ncbi:hypothetical protein BDFB_005570, partial [Asbolus verrucosus]
MFDTSESSDIEESGVLAAESLLPAKSKGKQKSKTYKSSTLWSIYSMLRTTLSVTKNIDIKKFVGLTEH